MQNILKNTAGGENSAAPWILLLILTGYIVAAFFAFSILSQVLIVVIYGLDLAELASILTNPKETEYARSAIMMMQAITSVGMFIITPLFFLYKNLHLKFNEFLNSPESPLRPAFMTILIMLCFMIANSIVIEWNQGIKMPESLSWFENWAQEKELQLEELTEYLTSFANIGQFLIALIVIAVIPAVGEELLFRGLIQNLLSKAFSNQIGRASCRERV